MLGHSVISGMGGRFAGTISSGRPTCGPRACGDRSRAAVLVSLFLVLCFVFSGKIIAQSAGALSSTGMSVQVARTAVRETASVAGAILGYLGYGVRVSVVETKDGWSRIMVALDKGTGYGWVRASALAAKKIPGVAAGSVKSGVIPGPAKSGVTESEIVLAGRGFNKSIEDSYRESSLLDYSWIDKMEGFGFDEAATLDFIGGKE